MWSLCWMQMTMGLSCRASVLGRGVVRRLGPGCMRPTADWLGSVRWEPGACSLSSEDHSVSYHGGVRHDGWLACAHVTLEMEAVSAMYLAKDEKKPAEAAWASTWGSHLSSIPSQAWRHVRLHHEVVLTG